MTNVVLTNATLIATSIRSTSPPAARPGYSGLTIQTSGEVVAWLQRASLASGSSGKGEVWPGS
jgi:hypothetical protein